MSGHPNSSYRIDIILETERSESLSRETFNIDATQTQDMEGWNCDQLFRASLIRELQRIPCDLSKEQNSELWKNKPTISDHRVM